MIITKEQLEALANNYANQKHNTDECIGFIDGLSAAVKLMSKLSERQAVGKWEKLPKIKIGKYVIADISKEEGCEGGIWIEDTESGEGGQFQSDSLFPAIHAFYKEHF
jgi:hypothetical protein